MKPTLFSLILLSFSLGMASNSYGQKIPKAWTHDMRLEASYHGGMSRYSFELFITDSSSSMTEITHKGGKTYKKKFSQKDLNTLLTFLEAHRFDQFENNELLSPTRDKASESISLHWEYNVIIASETSVSSLQEKYQEDFNAIQEYVRGMFRKN